MDEEKKKDNQSKTSLSRLIISAVGFIAAGAYLLVLIFAPEAYFMYGLIIGVVFTAGIGAFLSKDPVDKRIGILIIAAGILIVLSFIPADVLTKISKYLLGGGAGVLIILGIINIVRFIKGLKNRSK